MTQSIWPDADNTAEILQDVRDGDSQAVERLLSRHRESLHRMIELRLDQRIKRRVDVSDVVQDVLIEANRRLKDYLDNPAMAFHLWIRQIAKDRLIDAHRRHRVSAKRSIDREQATLVQGTFDHSSLEIVAQLRDPAMTPAAAASQRELAGHVESVIARLGESDREIILMRHYEQLTNGEIAAALGLSEPAASMRYLRAIRRLRELLDEDASNSSVSRGE
ncbi:MAG: sigma-70 family RNA polymerase sigma factor [Aureliella sp.]|jgi:RNA polymerase sigma-70 factor (ECF subfamily)